MCGFAGIANDWVFGADAPEKNKAAPVVAEKLEKPAEKPADDKTGNEKPAVEKSDKDKTDGANPDAPPERPRRGRG